MKGIDHLERRVLLAFCLLAVAPVGALSSAEFTDQKAAKFRRAAWSADGRQLALAVRATASGNRLIVMSALDGGIAASARVGGDVNGMSFSPNGQAIAFGVTTPSGSQVRKLSIATGTSYTVANDALWPAYSPDGNSMAILRRRPDDSCDIWILRGSSSARVSTSRKDAAATGPLLWSPDSRSIAYVSGSAALLRPTVLLLRPGPTSARFAECGWRTRSSRLTWLSTSECAYIVYGRSSLPDGVVWNPRNGKCETRWRALPVGLFHVVQPRHPSAWSLLFDYDADTLQLVRSGTDGDWVTEEWPDGAPTENVSLLWTADGSRACLVRDTWIALVKEDGAEYLRLELNDLSY